jgi:hypothetical protein
MYTYQLDITYQDGTPIDMPSYNDILWEISEISPDARRSLVDGLAIIWRRVDEDMIEVSETYPEFILIITSWGDGEDSWRTYYHKGLLQWVPAEITFQAFDPDKLVPLDQPDNIFRED